MKGVVPVLLVVILSVLYDTNGLTLNDLYPYGEQNGDTAGTGNPILGAELLQPIDNIIGLGSNGLKANGYQARGSGTLGLKKDFGDSLNLYLLFRSTTTQSKVYGRVTNDPGLLRRAMNDINEAFPYTYCSSSPPTQLIIATWIDQKKTNTQEGSNFQLVIVTNGQATFGIAQFVNVVDSAEKSTTNGIYTWISRSFKRHSSWPYSSNPETAPNEMLNSNTPGTYKFSLNSYDLKDNASICKRKLFQLACESWRLKGETVPDSCN